MLYKNLIADNVVTPANWLPGNPVIAKPPKTYKELKNTMKNCDKKYSCLDWYLCFINQENRQNMPEYIDKSNDSKYVYPKQKSINKPNSKRNEIQKYKTVNPNCHNLKPNCIPICFRKSRKPRSNLSRCCYICICRNR